MTKPTMVQVCFVCLARWRRSGCVPPLFTERRFDHAAVGGLPVEIEAHELILLLTGRSRPGRIPPSAPILGSDHAHGRGPNAYGTPPRSTDAQHSDHAVEQIPARLCAGSVRLRAGLDHHQQGREAPTARHPHAKWSGHLTGGASLVLIRIVANPASWFPAR